MAKICIDARVLFLALVVVLLGGCFGERTVIDSLEDYNARLAYVLDTDFPQIVSPSLPALTASTSIKHDIEELSINLRDFYALQDCELGRVVAQRNTSLGKSQLPSQRLVYESKLLSVLSSCANAIRKSNPKLADTLGDWQQKKRIDYVKSWANLLQASKELRLALNTPERLISDTTPKNASASINSLFYIDGVKEIASQADIRPINSAELEAQLEIIQSARLPASLWRTQHVVAHNLDALSTALTPELQKVSCPDGRATEQAKILRNVFYLFFIEEIQPVGSLINQYHYKLVPLWQKWLEDAAFHSDFKQYIITQSQTNFTAYSHAVQTHVTLWQTFLKRCNLSPVAPTGA
jgi:hypothetical protein